MKKLNDDLLEGVSGGYIFNAGDISGSVNGYPWELLDDRNGQVIDRFSNREDAIAAAGRRNMNYSEIGWDEVQRLRR